MRAEGGRAGGGARIGLLLVLIGALALRLLYLATPDLDSDSAVFGLMAANILRGEIPWFQWGYLYLGTIASFTAAPLMLLFGEGRFALHLASVLYSLLFTWACYLIGAHAGGRRAGLWAAAFAAFPPVFLVWTNVVARGCYTETLAFGTLAFFFALRAVDAEQWHPRRNALIATGFILGLSFWTHLNTVLWGAAVLVFWLVEQPRLIPRALLWSGLPFLAGSAPFWVVSVATKFATLTFWPLPVAPLSERFAHLVSYQLPVILGVFYDFGTEPTIPLLAWLLVPLQAGSLVGLLPLALRGPRTPASRAARLILIFAVIAICGYLFSTFSGAATQRYLIPLYTVLAVAPALAIHRLGTAGARWGVALGCTLVALQLIPTVRAAKLFDPPALRKYRESRAQEEELFRTLTALGTRGVYTEDYWVGPKYTLDAQERIIFAIPFGERRPQYTDFVNADDRKAYLFTNRGVAEHFEDALRLAGASFVRAPVAGHTLYHSIRPTTESGPEIPVFAVSSSVNEVDAALAIDRDAATRWSTVAPQKPGAWFTVDLGRTQEVGEILLLPRFAVHAPRGLRVEASPDGHEWSRIVEIKSYWGPFCWAQGQFVPQLDGWVVARFPPARGRWLRLTQLGDDYAFPWEIAEVIVRAPGTNALRPPDRLPPGPGRVLADAVLATRIPGALRTLESRFVPPLGQIPVVPLVRGTDRVLLPIRDPLAATREDRRIGLTAALSTPFGDYALLEGLKLATGDLARLSVERWDFNPAGETARIDLARTTRVAGVVVGHSGSDFPRGLVARTSVDGSTWSGFEALEPRPPELMWSYEAVLGESERERIFIFGVPRAARYLELSAAPRNPLRPWMLKGPAVLAAPGRE